MYILPALTYLEVVGAAGASEIFIFEHFNYEPIIVIVAWHRPTLALSQEVDFPSERDGYA